MTGTAAEPAAGLVQTLGFSGLAGLAAACFLVYLYVHSRTAGLDHVPGPFLARYTNLHAWVQANRHAGTDYCYLRELHDRYGDFVRVAPRRVSVADPEAIPVIYGLKNSLNKSELIRAARPKGDGPENLFSVRDSRIHAQMRRATANAYAVSTIVQYEPRIDDTLEKLFGILDQQSGPAVNLGRLIHYYVYDVQGNMTYGEPLGYLDEQRDVQGLAKQTKELRRYVTFTMPMPILHDICSFLLRCINIDDKRAFHTFTTRKVRERLAQHRAERESSAAGGPATTTTTEKEAAPAPAPAANDEKPKTTTNTTNNTKNAPRRADILDHFIASKDRYPDLMSDEQIVTHCMVNVVGGVGTSTLSIINVLRYLIAHPDAQARLHAELAHSSATSDADADSDNAKNASGAAAGGFASWQQTQGLPFLEALVREGVRTRGSDTFNPNGRVVGDGGLALPSSSSGPLLLPAGTVVGVKPTVAAVQARTFGPTPREFNPERWLRKKGKKEGEYEESEAEFAARRARMDRGDMSFSAGTRGCIGRGIAMMQIYKLLATLLLRYEVS
ncbi:cytochrome P450 [Xylariaceae sp. FL0804]|nr:cytochrome P450 [Xylariaceae sp. FL0804]